MEPAKARAMALRLMDEHKVPAKWEFKFDRSKFRFGSARRAMVRGRVVHQITLSKPLTEASSEESVKNTILHEIAHVLAGLENGHNEKWKRKARRLGVNLTPTDDENRATYAVVPYKYWCMDCSDYIMVSHKAVSTAHLTCSKHPEAVIERHTNKEPEVILSVV